mgnify:CR=1 FL=1
MGPSFVNLQFLRKSGYRNTPATAIMSATLVVYYAVYFSMLVLIGLFTGRNMFSGRDTDEYVGYRAGRGGCGAVHCDDDSAVAPLGDPSSYAAGQDVYQQLLDVLSQPRQLTVSCLARCSRTRPLGSLSGRPASVRLFIESD